MVFWAENPKSRDHRLPVTAISQQVQTWHITHTTSMLSTAYTGTQPALLAHQHHPTDSSIQIPKFRHDVTEIPYWQLVQTLACYKQPTTQHTKVSTVMYAPNLPPLWQVLKSPTTSSQHAYHRERALRRCAFRVFLKACIASSPAAENPWS